MCIINMGRQTNKPHVDEHGGHYDANGHYINKYGQRDALMGMAMAGEHLAQQPLLINNNWADAMSEDYQFITSGQHPDLLPDLRELRRIQRKYQNK